MRPPGIPTVVVLLVSLGTWGLKRSEVYRRETLSHAASEANYKGMLKTLKTMRATPVLPRRTYEHVMKEGSTDLIAGIEPFDIDLEAIWARKAARHALLRSKYEWAARFPWFPVPPVPPDED